MYRLNTFMYVEVKFVLSAKRLKPKIDICINRNKKFTIRRPYFYIRVTNKNRELHNNQKGTYYLTTKVFNHLPTRIEISSHDIRQFKYV
jgi:hypothetical protein